MGRRTARPRHSPQDAPARTRGSSPTVRSGPRVQTRRRPPATGRPGASAHQAHPSHRQLRQRLPRPLPGCSRPRKPPAAQARRARARSAARSSSRSWRAGSAGAAARSGSHRSAAGSDRPAGRRSAEAQHPDARRGQLDGQRDAVQAPADLRHRRRVLLVEREAGLHRPARSTKRRDASCCISSVAGSTSARSMRRRAARATGPAGRLAGDAQRLAAGRQDAQGRAIMEQRSAQLGARRRSDARSCPRSAAAEAASGSHRRWCPEVAGRIFVDAQRAAMLRGIVVGIGERGELPSARPR